MMKDFGVHRPLVATIPANRVLGARAPNFLVMEGARGGGGKSKKREMGLQVERFCKKILLFFS